MRPITSAPHQGRRPATTRSRGARREDGAHARVAQDCTRVAPAPVVTPNGASDQDAVRPVVHIEYDTYIQVV
jgi:hypothetical protein